MALDDSARRRIDSWFTPKTREEEVAWVDQLVEIAALYTERGFTRGEGATLFLLSAILFQVTSTNAIVERWDEDGAP